MPSASRGEEADAAAGSLPPTTDEPSQALAGSDSPDSPPRPLERSVGQLPSPPLLPTPPPKAGSKTTKNVTGGSACTRPSVHRSRLSTRSQPISTRGPPWAGSQPGLRQPGLWAGAGQQFLASSSGCREQTPGAPSSRWGGLLARVRDVFQNLKAEDAASPWDEDFVCLDIWVSSLSSPTFPHPFLPHSAPPPPSLSLMVSAHLFPCISPVSSIPRGRGGWSERGARLGGGPQRPLLL